MTGTAMGGPPRAGMRTAQAGDRQTHAFPDAVNSLRIQSDASVDVCFLGFLFPRWSSLFVPSSVALEVAQLHMHAGPGT